ncbi:MAG: GNAT family N-acetyltransferase [candidate division Zixibacteria bacterium]|nr:GNAT family N-acetyltransferase [candidate division Zixibacteria bacterium]
MSEKPLADSEIEIVDFHRKYANMFRDINYEWLEEYFSIEPYDRIVLEDPQKNVLDLGGYILFAVVAGEVLGTCALLKHSPTMYELAKMGVSKPSRGLGVGRRLLDAAIDRARHLGTERLILTTSKQLLAANKLYESAGFKHTDERLAGPLPYKRETIVMTMKL